MKKDILDCVLAAIEVRIAHGEDVKGGKTACPTPTGKQAVFHSIAAPSISIKDFFGRLRQYLGVSQECFVIACIYLDRLTDRGTGFVVALRSIHRLLAVALVLAAKTHDDKIFSNSFYSRVAGISLASLTALEQTMFRELDFDVFVSKGLYDYYEEALQQKGYGSASSGRIVQVQLPTVSSECSFNEDFLCETCNQGTGSSLYESE